MSYSARIPADVYRAVASCVSTDESRPILHGLQLVVREGGLRLTATDGRMLLSAHGGDDAESPAILPDGGVILPPVALSALGITAKQAESHVVRLTSEDGARWTVSGETSYGLALGRSATVEAIEGSYPTWENVLPRNVGEPVAIGRISLDLGGVAARFARHIPGRIALTFTGEEAAVLAQPCTPLRWPVVGFLMPGLARTRPDAAIPSWAAPAPVTEEAPAAA